MKQLFFFILFALFSLCGFGQIRSKPFALYSTLGFKSGFGLSTVYNANMMSDENLEYEAGLNYSLGIKTSVNFLSNKTINTIIGVQFEFLSNYSNIKFPVIDNNLGAYSKHIQFNTRDIAILGRYTNVNKRVMLELGPQFTSFKSIKAKNFGIHPNHQYYSSGFNYSSNYSNYISLVFGIGFYTKYFNLGLKQSYSLQSITLEHGNPVKDGFYNHPEVNSDYVVSYEKSRPTHIYAVQATIEYYIPFVKYKRYWRGKKELSIFEKIDTIYYWGNELE